MKVIINPELLPFIVKKEIKDNKNEDLSKQIDARQAVKNAEIIEKEKDRLKEAKGNQPKTVAHSHD